ncbi:hypothetical protein ACQ1PF_07925 [Ornithobacterium rhinotracheale]
MKNIRLKKLYKLSDEEIKEYSTILSLVKACPNFKYWFKVRGVKKSITELTFGQVTELKDCVQNGMDGIVRAFEIVYGLKPKQVWNLRAIRFYACLNFITKEVEKVIKVENQRYKVEESKDKGMHEQAGIRELEKFSDFAVVDTLANGDILKYDEVEKQPYLVVHFKLWYNATQENIRIRLEEINELKNK